MSNNTNQDSNPDISKNQEPTTDEIRTVLKPLFDEFTQVLQQHGLKGVEVVDFTTCISSKVVREATDSSKTMLDEYNEILRKTGFSDVYKDLEIIAFTIAATSLVRQRAFAQITDERREQILLSLKHKEFRHENHIHIRMESNIRKFRHENYIIGMGSNMRMEPNIGMESMELTPLICYDHRNQIKQCP